MPSAAATVFAFFNQFVQEMAEIAEFSFGSEVRRVRQLGQRGDGVHRRVEDQLRPLRRTSIVQSFGLQSRCIDQCGQFFDQLEGRVCRLERPHPGRSIEFVVHVIVGKARAAHEGGAANHVAGPASVRR